MDIQAEYVKAIKRGGMTIEDMTPEEIEVMEMSVKILTEIAAAASGPKTECTLQFLTLLQVEYSRSSADPRWEILRAFMGWKIMPAKRATHKIIDGESYIWLGEDEYHAKVYSLSFVREKYSGLAKLNIMGQGKVVYEVESTDGYHWTAVRKIAR